MPRTFLGYPLFEATPEGDPGKGGDDKPKDDAKPEGDKPADDKPKEQTDNKALEDLKKKNKEQADKLAAFEKKEKEEADKQKSIEQKLAERDAELAKTRREALVTKLAAKKGLDADLMDRVQGETEEEITADIDLLLSKFSPKKAEEEAPEVEAKGGKTPSGKPAGSPADVPQKTGARQAVDNWMAERSQKLKK